jgi:PucR C-terminal helix-turn-helix domain/GGDEF-like domain
VHGDSQAIDRQLSAAAAIVSARLVDVSQDVWDDLIRNIPQLRGDDQVTELLAASVESNVKTLLDILEHGIALDNLEPPAAALEYARRLAQRGVPLDSLVRAYRMGHGRFLTWCLEEALPHSEDSGEVVAVTGRLIEMSFRYIDGISERIISAYQQERDRWLLTENAARTGRVLGLLGDTSVDVISAENSVGYRLRQHHVGLVSWVPETTEGGKGLARLDRLAVVIAEALGCQGRPLWVPLDESTAWSWLPFGGRSDVVWDLVPDIVEAHDASARVAMGDPATGLAGFRQTHQQALRAQDVANVARPARRVTTFADVGPVALMLADLDATRGWVWLVLGGLAADDENDARLREALRAFLANGSSYTATAELLNLHKNTIQYRVRKAEEVIGHAVHNRRGDVELALRICYHLGSPVLRPAPV